MVDGLMIAVSRRLSTVNQILGDFLQMHMANGTAGIRLVGFVAFAKHWTEVFSDFIFKTFRKIGFGIGFRLVSLIFPLFYRHQKHIADRASALLEVQFFALAFHRTIVDGTRGNSLVGMNVIVVMVMVFH